MKNNDDFSENGVKILQICHGPLIPDYISAYSLRCHSLISRTKKRMISVGGAFFKDRIIDSAEQYRSLLLTGLAFLKGNRSFEIMIAKGEHIRRKYVDRLRYLVSRSDVIIFEGPWQFPLVQNLLVDKTVVYDAHNVEYLLREGNIYQNQVKSIEAELILSSDLILTFAKKDIDKFTNIYGVKDDKIFYAPHVIKKYVGEWKGLNSRSIVFIGSRFGPNDAALSRIYDIAKGLPEFNFEIIGSSRNTNKIRLKNVIHHGVVSEEEKDRIMQGCFLALNPITEGSGRNLKVFDYLSHGLPILSTPVGIRGFESPNLLEAVVVKNVEDFSQTIPNLYNDKNHLLEMSDMAFKLFEQFSMENKEMNAEQMILETFKNKQSSF